MKVIAFLILTSVLGLATESKSCGGRRTRRPDRSIVQPSNVNRPESAPTAPGPKRSPNGPSTRRGVVLSPAGVAQAVLPSVVTVLCDSSQGSGFVVGDGAVITNFHVVDSCGGSVTVQFWRADDKGLSAVGTVTGYDPTTDLALIECAELRSVPALTIRPDNEPLSVGEEIFSVGNPRGLSRTFAAGLVSALDRDDSGSPRFQISAPISPGSSGGPIADMNARVVGVAVSTVPNGQNLNLAVPASELRRFLNNQRGE